MAQQALTHILVIRRPDETKFQVVGTQESLESLCELLRQVPKEIRGDGVIVGFTVDAVYVNSDGEEVDRVPNGNAIHVSDLRDEVNFDPPQG